MFSDVLLHSFAKATIARYANRQGAYSSEDYYVSVSGFETKVSLWLLSSETSLCVMLVAIFMRCSHIAFSSMGICVPIPCFYNILTYYSLTSTHA